MEGEAEAEVEIITLTDEDGADTDYAVLTVVTLEGEEYAILAPVEQLDADQPDLDLYAFRYREVGDDDVELDAVDDAELLERVFALAEEVLFEGEFDEDFESDDDDDDGEGESDDEGGEEA